MVEKNRVNEEKDRNTQRQETEVVTDSRQVRNQEGEIATKLKKKWNAKSTFLHFHSLLHTKLREKKYFLKITLEDDKNTINISINDGY